MRKLIILFLILLIKIGKLEDKPKSTKLTVRFAEFFFRWKKTDSKSNFPCQFWLANFQPKWTIFCTSVLNFPKDSESAVCFVGLVCVFQ